MSTIINHEDKVWSACGCTMLHAFAWLFHNISQHDPTILQDAALKCCEALPGLHFVLWLQAKTINQLVARVFPRLKQFGCLLWALIVHLIQKTRK